MDQALRRHRAKLNPHSRMLPERQREADEKRTEDQRIDADPEGDTESARARERIG